MPREPSPTDQEDAGWMAAAAGDGAEAAAALEKLFERHAPQIYGICLKILCRPAEAQAVISDVFYELWRRADRFNPDRGSVRSYLVTLARSRAIDRLRAEANRTAHEAHLKTVGSRSQEAGRSVESRTEVHGPLESAIVTEEGILVRQALAELDGDQRESIELAYFEGLTHREIAEKLDIPLGTAKTHIRLGLKKIRKLVVSKGVREQ